MKPTETIRVFIADDHQVLIDGLTSLLNKHNEFQVVGFSNNGFSLSDKVIKSNADILILDINMPHIDGLMALKELAIQKEQMPKILILSSHQDMKVIKESMKLGAKGYLTKDLAAENIIEAIKEINSGGEYLSSEIREKIYHNFTQQHTHSLQEPTNANEYPISMLTEREIDIMRLITLEYSNKEIADELNISIFTVETHRKNILKKIQARNTVGIIKYAIKNQLI